MRNWLRGTVLVMAAAAVLVMVWQAAVTAYRVPAYLVPTPDAVWHSAVLHWQVLLRQTGTTLGAASLGLLVSSLFAAGAAMLFTVSRDAEQAMTPAPGVVGETAPARERAAHCGEHARNSVDVPVWRSRACGRRDRGVLLARKGV